MRLADEVFAVTGGNPVLTHGILDDVAAFFPSTEQDAPVYGSMFARSVVSQLRTNVGAQTTAVVEAASVLGPSCSPDRLSRVTGLEQQELRRILAGLAASGILRDGLTPHVRVREVLLGSAEAETLRVLRLCVAEVLHEDGLSPEIVAQHLLAAGTAPQSWAVGVLCDAADEAMRAMRHAHAVSLLRLASRWSTEYSVRTEINATLLDLTWHQDPTATAAHQLNNLVADAREGRLSARTMARLSRLLARHGMADEAGELLRLSAAASSGGAQTRIERATAEFWLHHLFPGSPQAVSGGDLNLPLELIVGQFPWLESARGLSTLIASGEQDAAAARAEEILQRGRPNHTNLEARQAALFSLLAMERFDPDAPWFTTTFGEEAPAGTIERWWSSMLHVAHGVSCWWKGDLRAAADEVEQALELADVQQWDITAGLVHALQLVVMTEQGRHAEAERGLAQQLPHSSARSPYGLVYLRARGRHHLAVGGLQAALADFHSCGRILTSWRMELPGLVPWRLDLAEALLRLGQQEAARGYIDEHFERFPTGDTRTHGIALRLRASTLPLASQAAVLRKSVTRLEMRDDSLELARSLGALARTYQRTGDLAYGRRTLGRAEKLARNCGGALALREISAVSDQGITLLTPSGPCPGPAAGDARLTPSERKVAMLAAEGFTNREIADTVYVTASTVEQHLTRIYRKLNIRSRTELVAHGDQFVPVRRRKMQK
ncbi:LuxR C-terminal-related transcriptional regulator [Streptomyces avermitilis]